MAAHPRVVVAQGVRAAQPLLKTTVRSMAKHCRNIRRAIAPTYPFGHDQSGGSEIQRPANHVSRRRVAWQRRAPSLHPEPVSCVQRLVRSRTTAEEELV